MKNKRSKGKVNSSLNFCYSILQIALVVFVVVLGVSWARYKGYLTIFNKVSAEVIFTSVVTAIIALFKYYTSAIKATANGNAELIKILENRIDSALVQIADLRNIELEDTRRLDELAFKQDELNETIRNHREKLLQERLEITQTFYKEILEIHKYISYQISEEGLETIKRIEQDVTKTKEI